MLSRRELLQAAAHAPLLAQAPWPSPWRDQEAELLNQCKELAANRSVLLRVLLPEGSLANVQGIARRFQDQTGVAIETKEVPVDEVNSRAILQSASGEAGFDIALPATFGLPDLAESGALLPLSQLAAKHEPSDLGQGSLYRLGDRYKGEFYGYQADGDVYLMFYNRGLLSDPDLAKAFADAHGKELAIPTTWAELDAQMAFFHKPAAGRFGGTLFRIAGYIEWEWWIRLHAKGQLPVDGDMHPTFQGEAGLEALHELIAASAWQTPGSTSQGLFENWQDYGKGHAYANIGWGGTKKSLNGPGSKVANQLDYGPTPGGMLGGELLPISYFNWGWNYVVSAQSQEAELAYLFTLFASLPGPSTLAVREAGGFFDPHREAHYTDPAIREVYSAPFLEQHRQSMQACIPDFYLHGRDEYFSKLGRFLERANLGELSPERALDLAAKSWELITDKLGRDNQIEQWRQLRASYPAHVLAHQQD